MGESAIIEADKLWFKSWPSNVKKLIELPKISIHERFEEVVKKKQDDTFLSLITLTYSYNYIKNLSEKFARYLIDHEIKRGDKVGLFMPNIPQFVISFFGTLKIGAVVVPLNPLYGSEDLKFQINDSEVKIIVALDILYPTLEQIRQDCPKLTKIIVASIGELLSAPKRIIAQLIRKIPKSPSIAKDDDLFLKTLKTLSPYTKNAEVDLENDIAVLPYTGGTTGKPKGTMLTNFNIMSNLTQAKEWASQMGDDHSFVGAVPFFHLIGLTTVFLATMHFEGRVALVPNPRDFNALLKTISDNKPAYFHGVPTLFRALLNQESLKKYDLSSLKVVFSGSAPLPAKLAEEFVKKATKGNAMMVEAYGMTELSPMASANPMEKEKLKFGSIGVPIVNTEMKIINYETTEELSQGEIGEIVVKGPQVMKGYWKSPEETLKIMTPDRFLRTGDLGYMDSDGYFYVVNRVKDIILASGYKIFPSEVENFLEQHPSISEVAVIRSADEYRGETAKAFIVLDENKPPIKEDDIIRYCEGKIAKYKIPTKIEFRKELPKTTIGKIDRKLLREQEQVLVEEMY